MHTSRFPAPSRAPDSSLSARGKTTVSPLPLKLRRSRTEHGSTHTRECSITLRTKEFPSTQIQGRGFIYSSPQPDRPFYSSKSLPIQGAALTLQTHKFLNASRAGQRGGVRWSYKLAQEGSLVSWQAAPGGGECRTRRRRTSFAFPWPTNLWTEGSFQSEKRKVITGSTNEPSHSVVHSVYTRSGNRLSPQGSRFGARWSACMGSGRSAEAKRVAKHAVSVC